VCSIAADEIAQATPLTPLIQLILAVSGETVACGKCNGQIREFMGE
jgi:hypothetical protein